MTRVGEETGNLDNTLSIVADSFGIEAADKLQTLLEKILTTRLREQQTTDGKPVVVSMSSVAASGGYFVSAPADVKSAKADGRRQNPCARSALRGGRA